LFDSWHIQLQEYIASPRMRLCLLLLLLPSCALFQNRGRSSASATSKANTLQEQVTALEVDAAKLTAARDDELWAFWLGGPKPKDDALASHLQLLTDASLSAVRQARQQNLLDTDRLNRLEALMVGVRVGRAIREAEETVFNLEASLTFPFEGREVAFRDLSRLLAQETSAPRRAKMWEASIPAAQKLAAAWQARTQAQIAALKAQNLTPEAFAALLGRQHLPAQAELARRFLVDTAEIWSERVRSQHISSRADIPAWLRSKSAVETAFPKERIAERATELLSDMGLYGVAGLTLDLTDNAKKQPLPLTVLGVRTSYKPHGGFKDQQALFAELGRALVLVHAPTAKREVLETTAALFASLAWNKPWLEGQGMSATAGLQAFQLGKDQLLVTLRRASGALLHALGEPDALNRALGEDHQARNEREVEPGFEAAEIVRAQASGQALAVFLETVAHKAKWWANPSAVQALKTYWKSGQLPKEAQSDAAAGTSLLKVLREGPKQSASDSARGLLEEEANEVTHRSDGAHLANRLELSAVEPDSVAGGADVEVDFRVARALHLLENGGNAASGTPHR
jgi:hypothetical protein